jgi:hypothetical protein
MLRLFLNCQIIDKYSFKLLNSIACLFNLFSHFNNLLLNLFDLTLNSIYAKDCHGYDRMVVGFTTTCAISAYYR